MPFPSSAVRQVDFLSRNELHKVMRHLPHLVHEFDSPDEAPHDIENNPLNEAPQAKIERPFLIVPGFRTKRTAFYHLIARLTANGLNGGRPVYVRGGDFYEDQDCLKRIEHDALPRDARVFVVSFENPNAPPGVTAGWLASCLQSVKHATRSNRVDVEGYSMGGLAARVYLDRGGNDIGRLFLLGTPNRGASLANFARFCLTFNIEQALALGGINGAHRAALDWLALDTNGKVRNPVLRDLNSRWESQFHRVEALHSVGTTGRATMTAGWRPVAWGDGVVQESSVMAPVGTVSLLKGAGRQRHGHLNSDVEVYREMIKFFGWKPVEG